MCNTPTKKINKKNVDKKSKPVSSPTPKDQGQTANVWPHVPKSVLVPPASSFKVGEEQTTPSLQEVEVFFRKHNYPSAEAKKFFYYNQGKAWMISESLPVTDWKSIAHKWMLNTKTQKQNSNDRTPQLYTPRDKKYSEPL